MILIVAAFPKFGISLQKQYANIPICATKYITKKNIANVLKYTLLLNKNKLLNITSKIPVDELIKKTYFNN